MGIPIRWVKIEGAALEGVVRGAAKSAPCVSVWFPAGAVYYDGGSWMWSRDSIGGNGRAALGTRRRPHHALSICLSSLTR